MLLLIFAFQLQKLCRCFHLTWLSSEDGQACRYVERMRQNLKLGEYDFGDANSGEAAMILQVSKEEVSRYG